MINAFSSSFGRFLFEVVAFLGGAGLLIQVSVRESLRRPIYFRLIIEQVYQIGVKSLPLVAATAFSTGMVMALQFGYGLEQFGGKLYVPKVVSLSIVRELGPVFTGLMLAARVGAGIASEIGSMTVTQQIDAIRALGTSPIKKVVIPRIVATFISLPILTVLANTIGIFGGLLVCAYELGIDAEFYIQKVTYTVVIKDYMEGIMKTCVFAFLISVPACYFGLKASAGTRGVGIATTKAVVVSSILIVTSDFFLSKLLWILTRWTLS
jgi:phospholipid/cholesterol/gamma-HCH transport system permease protein